MIPLEMFAVFKPFEVDLIIAVSILICLPGRGGWEARTIIFTRTLLSENSSILLSFSPLAMERTSPLGFPEKLPILRLTPDSYVKLRLVMW